MTASNHPSPALKVASPDRVGVRRDPDFPTRLEIVSTRTLARSCPTRSRQHRRWTCAAGILATVLGLQSAPWVTYPGGQGPGQGKHIVLVSGDEEYRSEEALPMLGRILADRHGFKCTVLFAIDPATGLVNPNCQTNIPGLHLLDTADLLILFTRFRELPDDQMRPFVDYVNSGKPIIGIRTATHAFAYSRNQSSPYARYDWRSRDWPGGFGRQVLGETWVNHHGNHGVESTRGILNAEHAEHPVLRGVRDLWGPTDVYEVRELPKGCQVLVYGQVLEGMRPTDAPVAGAKNDPMMPLIWVRQYAGETGRSSSVLCSTIGASVDLQNADLRRLFVNASYWMLGLADRLPAAANVDYLGPYEPSYFGFNGYRKGKRPEDFE